MDLEGTNHLVCYFSNWAWYRPGDGKYSPDNIPPGLCSVLIYAFAILDETSLTMVPSDPWADIENNFFNKVLDHKRFGSKVLIALGGWTDSAHEKYSKLFSNSTARANFIQESVKFIEQWQFDGLDLDYEYVGCRQGDCSKPGSVEKEHFNDFVRELDEAYTARGWLLSAAVPVTENVLNTGYDIAFLGKHLSFINMMAYNMAGLWEGRTGHHGALHDHEWSVNAKSNGEWAVNFWIQQGAPANKLMLGVPVYGRSFALTDRSSNGMGAPISGLGEAAEYTRNAGYMAYYEICIRTYSRGWSTHQDPAYRFGPYSWSGDNWVAYDSPMMADRKVDLLKSKGLGGAMVW